MTTRRNLLENDADLAVDERVLHDMLDGEAPDAMDVLRRCIRASLWAEALAEAAKARADDIAARAKRYQARADALRNAVTGALDCLGLHRLQDAEFTASLTLGRPGVVITDDAVIPNEFCRVTRSPDKKAIGDALKAGRDVPGAMLNNPQPTLTLRTKGAPSRPCRPLCPAQSPCCRRPWIRLSCWPSAWPTRGLCQRTFRSRRPTACW